MPNVESNRAAKITSWKPEPGWLLLLPSRLPDKQGGIILPESFTKKNNTGICFAPEEDNPYLGKECLFPSHQEYQIVDTDTQRLIYIVEENKILMSRTPPSEIIAASWSEGVDSFSVSTIERNIR
jgi:hypothetical protein